MAITTKPTAATYKDTYQEVTDAVIQALEEGTVIWQCSWNKAGLPKNITTNIEYRGWNIFWLNFHTMLKGYSTPYYITYKQAEQLGGTVKKGERGIKIVYWATIELKATAEQNNEDQATASENNELQRTIMVPKAHTVFNINQTEGINYPVTELNPKTPFEAIEVCEQIIAHMPLPPTICTKGSSAYYIPSTDTVTVPSLQPSTSSEGYYSTLFHELAHSTGHPTRLNRKELVESDGFGNINYAKEELTAEMTAAFLCAITGIDQPTLPNSAAYIKGWLKALKNDKTLVIKAAAQAQRAADYITNITYHPH